MERSRCFGTNPRGEERMKLLLLLIGVLILSSGCIQTGSGVATDSIARIYYSGIVWHTWKVQLTNDHPIDGDQQVYGIENNVELVRDLQHYADTGERVKLYYTTNFVRAPWNYSDSEAIYKVEKTT